MLDVARFLLGWLNLSSGLFVGTAVLRSGRLMQLWAQWLLLINAVAAIYLGSELIWTSVGRLWP
ncbi:hypothetical protein OSH11_13740 [Kaistia dalseonensis]|uniref:Uncharacterized protein n=1 Tax=Kaistia dalseonensis TaxID=410840 RepID=A0ABU0HA83_9HYPH|nr:hypothetical protein [Kaistia dalseonensis]MCX5495771.1 hypothetical protein [Kaistia dalseonensis]MDQ0438371.1 hypothetical protein [Kaistia dalseonensis]